MKKSRLITTLIASGLALSIFSGSTSAASYFSGIVTIPIPDNDATGITSTINVPDSVSVGSLSVTFDMDHTWVGDLIVRLVSPDGTQADLICRVDSIDCASLGDSSNLSTLAGAYTFEDGGADFWAAAAGLDSSGVIPGGVYEATTIGGAPVSLDATFGGLNSLGNWTLFVSDNAGLDLGTLNSWSLDITPVPVPAAVWLFGSGLLGLVGIARRKKTA